MARNTPALMSKGRYVLTAPWSTNPTLLYTCIEVRQFDAVYLIGKDVYQTFYVTQGLVEGSTAYTASPFSFQQEKRDKVAIVTLLGDDGSLIYVPDSFILSYPDLSEIKYTQRVLHCSLGAIPTYVDLSALKVSVANLVAESIGVVPSVNEAWLSITDTPTKVQHDILESARLANITLLETDRAKALRLEQKNILLQQQITTLTGILQTNGLLPT